LEEAGAEGGPDEREGEANRRRVEHGQGAAAVNGSPEEGARDESKEGSSAENDGESGDGEREDEGEARDANGARWMVRRRSRPALVPSA
jgi:hypothetical protein